MCVRDRMIERMNGCMYLSMGGAGRDWFRSQAMPMRQSDSLYANFLMNALAHKDGPVCVCSKQPWIRCSDLCRYGDD